ncbi:MAG: acetylxylan esterase, partial [Spirochaetales bacterium]|nr:acetylxylan esterase [Spirochaetales bacterium]
MPVLDMPLEQLKHYRGTNPRPGDFDAYWEKALYDVKQVNPDVEIVKADFETEFADCFHLYFTGTHNARIHA